MANDPSAQELVSLVSRLVTKLDEAITMMESAGLGEADIPYIAIVPGQGESEATILVPTGMENLDQEKIFKSIARIAKKIPWKKVGNVVGSVVKGGLGGIAGGIPGMIAGAAAGGLGSIAGGLGNVAGGLPGMIAGGLGNVAGGLPGMIAGGLGNVLGGGGGTEPAPEPPQWQQPPQPPPQWQQQPWQQQPWPQQPWPQQPWPQQPWPQQPQPWGRPPGSETAETHPATPLRAEQVPAELVAHAEHTEDDGEDDERFDIAELVGELRQAQRALLESLPAGSNLEWKKD